MILYHFCAAKHVKNILRKGLNVGCIAEPTSTGFILHNGWIWLTTDPDPKHQSWATQNRIKYSRTAWRLTVEIPDSESGKLYDESMLPYLYPGTDKLFKGWSGSDNWRVFHGSIPPKWIICADDMTKGGASGEIPETVVL